MPRYQGSADITGSDPWRQAQEEGGTPKPSAAAAEAPRPDGTVVYPEQNQPQVSASERAILERLQARRQELEARAREIDIRESLLKAAEKRIETQGRGIEGASNPGSRPRPSRRPKPMPRASRASSPCMRA